MKLVTKMTDSSKWFYVAILVANTYRPSVDQNVSLYRCFLQISATQFIINSFIRSVQSVSTYVDLPLSFRFLITQLRGPISWY